MSDRNVDFVQQTRTKTEEKRLTWDTTADQDVFTASVGVRYVLLLSKFEGSFGDRHVLSLQDELGRDVHSVKSGDVPGYERELSELYEMARRQALKSDEKLDDVLSALKEL